MQWEIYIPGDPRGKERPRFSRASGRIYTPRKTEIFENRVALAFRQKYPDQIPSDEDLQITVSAAFRIPASWSKKKRERARGHWCRKKPDADNILKAVCDGLNGVAYTDDAQIVRALIEKRHGDVPGIVILLEELIE